VTPSHHYVAITDFRTRLTQKPNQASRQDNTNRNNPKPRHSQAKTDDGEGGGQLTSIRMHPYFKFQLSLKYRKRGHGEFIPTKMHKKFISNINGIFILHLTGKSHISVTSNTKFFIIYPLLKKSPLFGLITFPGKALIKHTPPIGCVFHRWA
jgi:hypothetical protein